MGKILNEELQRIQTLMGINENSKFNFLKRRLSPETFIDLLPGSLAFAKNRVRKMRGKIKGDFFPRFQSMVIGVMFDTFWSNLPQHIEHEQGIDEFVWDYLHTTFNDDIEQAFNDVMSETES